MLLRLEDPDVAAHLDAVDENRVLGHVHRGEVQRATEIVAEVKTGFVPFEDLSGGPLGRFVLESSSCDQIAPLPSLSERK